MEKTREPIVDGIFYPQEGRELGLSVETLLRSAGGPAGRAAAVVGPHGAFERSGRLVAAAFHAVAGRSPRRIFVLGPIHRDAGDGIYLPESDAFNTPLGPCRVDKETVAQIASASTKCIIDDIPHLEEHAIEVHLPFIRFLFPEARIVPILLGKSSRANVKILYQAMELALMDSRDDSVVVASANLAGNLPPEEAALQSDELIRLFCAGDWQAMVEAANGRGLSSCGVGVMACVAALFVRGGNARLLGRISTTSDDRRGLAVEYAALAVGGS